MSIWPGFNHLWRHGSFHALTIAVLFGLVLNLAWLATFVWPIWLSGWVVWSLWLGIGLAVVASVIHSALMDRDRNTPVARIERDSLLSQAQEHYLQADYFEAEQLLNRSAFESGIDIEAELLKISIFRRTARYKQALESIHRLELRERSAVWCQELQIEKQRCLIGKIQTPPAHE